ncbi:MAG: ParB-like protein [Elusimicrobiota bacterium]
MGKTSAVLTAWLLAGAVAVSAQIAAPRASFTSPVAALPAFAEPSAAAAAGLSPAPLSPALLSAPALAPAFAAPMSASEPRAQKPEKAAAPSEFPRLVADLMSNDAARSNVAVQELLKLKEAHLNDHPDSVKTRILDLKPMQIPAGMYEVQDKAKKLRDMKNKESEAWLKENSVPVVEDYKGRQRPVDHHHEARAAWEADIDDAYTHHYFDDEMHARLKALPREQFYAVTRAMGLFYDRDQFGAGPHDPNHLPEDVRGMGDDPFRSVAWQVRKRGGYDKTAVPFAEFKWAQFFRDRVKTYPTKADFEKTVVEAMALVHDPGASDLPGYKSK